MAVTHTHTPIHPTGPSSMDAVVPVGLPSLRLPLTKPYCDGNASHFCR